MSGPSATSPSPTGAGKIRVRSGGEAPRTVTALCQQHSEKAVRRSRSIRGSRRATKCRLFPASALGQSRDDRRHSLGLRVSAAAKNRARWCTAGERKPVRAAEVHILAQRNAACGMTTAPKSARFRLARDRDMVFSILHELHRQTSASRCPVKGGSRSDGRGFVRHQPLTVAFRFGTKNPVSVRRNWPEPGRAVSGARPVQYSELMPTRRDDPRCGGPAFRLLAPGGALGWQSALYRRPYTRHERVHPVARIKDVVLFPFRLCTAHCASTSFLSAMYTGRK